MNFNCFYKFSCVFLLAFLSLAYADSPYAVRKVGTTSGGAEIGEYGYDTANNRLTKTPAGATNPTQTITMDLTTKPATITTEWGTDSILQGIGGKRYLRVHADGRKRFYLQGMEYRIDDDGASSVVYIRANGYSPDVQVTLSGSGTHQYTYLLKDHLGSPLRTVDDTGALTSAARYDPWGQQVAAIGVATNYDSVQNIENAENVRGYTGHELIATANMGHFNGRIFDYEGGGFAGPDKYIQGRSIASLNRFALGHNNNPNVTDPTGWAVRYHFANDRSRELFLRYFQNIQEQNLENQSFVNRRAMMRDRYGLDLDFHFDGLSLRMDLSNRMGNIEDVTSFEITSDAIIDQDSSLVTISHPRLFTDEEHTLEYVRDDALFTVYAQMENRVLSQLQYPGFSRERIARSREFYDHHFESRHMRRAIQGEEVRHFFINAAFRNLTGRGPNTELLPNILNARGQGSAAQPERLVMPRAPDTPLPPVMPRAPTERPESIARRGRVHERLIPHIP